MGNEITVNPGQKPTTKSSTIHSIPAFNEGQMAIVEPGDDIKICNKYL